MEIVNVSVTNNSIKMQLKLEKVRKGYLISPIYKFSCIEYRLKVIMNDNYDDWCLVILLKKCLDDEMLCTFKVISKELNIKKKFLSDDSEWRELGTYPSSSYSFDLEINVGIKTTPLLKLLVNDSFLLELKGIDGSILMHGAVLAAVSKVFRKMITDDFKEKKEARVELPYSVCVLQDLKDYLYLNTFNIDNLENLFMFANCYMMNELRHTCLTKLFTLSLKNIHEDKDTDIDEEAQVKE